MVTIAEKIQCALKAGYEPREIPSFLRATPAQVNDVLDSVRKSQRYIAKRHGLSILPIWSNL